MVRGWAVSLIYFDVGFFLSLTSIEAWHDIRILDLQIRGGTGIVELSRCCEIESMELCKLPGGERKV